MPRFSNAPVHQFGTTIFAEMSALATATGAINLGQGFPDFDGPDEVKQAAWEAIQGGVIQYAMGHGATVLREAIAAHALRVCNQLLDPPRMACVTRGQSAAICDGAMRRLASGDEEVV